MVDRRRGPMIEFILLPVRICIPLHCSTKWWYVLWSVVVCEMITSIGRKLPRVYLPHIL